MIACNELLPPPLFNLFLFVSFFPLFFYCCCLQRWHVFLCKVLLPSITGIPLYATATHNLRLKLSVIETNRKWALATRIWITNLSPSPSLSNPLSNPLCLRWREKREGKLKSIERNQSNFRVRAIIIALGGGEKEWEKIWLWTKDILLEATNSVVSQFRNWSKEENETRINFF